MLASLLLAATHTIPLSPRHSSEETNSQYAPSKDADAFKALLPPIEFVEGSSSGALAIPYDPINVPPKVHRAETRSAPLSPVLTSPKSPNPPLSPTRSHPLYNGVLDSSWLPRSAVGAGMLNDGNTCFLNSALQCLLHTSPLLHVLDAHGKADPCHVQSGFCMVCELKEVAGISHSRRAAFRPRQITLKLHLIAKHMQRGRQEDSHEFLRYAVDALQKSCLAGHSPKLDPKIAETTWVHKIFGGRLRSRVTCLDCGHNSDTFDSILDLSLDIFGVYSLKEALKNFVGIENLRGADKYKCERCKRPVVAHKQLTLHDSPYVLTVHLKRFSPLGRKIGHHVRYDERLSLQPFMSTGQYGPIYSLYGIICHAGGGPNSGHYFSYVKGRSGWYLMNDDLVSHTVTPPVSLRSAYVLFYIREKGQALEAVLNTKPTTNLLVPPKVHLAMKKRRVVESDDEGEEDLGVKASVSKVPLSPSSLHSSSPAPAHRFALDFRRLKTDHIPSPDESKTVLKDWTPPSSSPTINASVQSQCDPQADTLKKKIEALSNTAAAALDDLTQYASSGDENVPELDPVAMSPTKSSSPVPPPQTPSPAIKLGPIPENVFYTPLKTAGNIPEPPRLGKWMKGNNSKTSPRRRPYHNQRHHSPLKSFNPYNRLAGSHNLHYKSPRIVHTYAGRKNRSNLEQRNCN